MAHAEGSQFFAGPLRLAECGELRTADEQKRRDRSIGESVDCVFIDGSLLFQTG